MMVAQDRSIDLPAAETPEGKSLSPAQPSLWNIAGLSGRFVEISGSHAAASLSLAFGLVLEAQERGEPVGWITPKASSFYPPDAAQSGVDLDALVVVRVPDARAVPRVGEKLVRSGAFGLVALDVGAANIPVPLQARLAALCLKHHTAIVCLTEKEAQGPSLGSLVSLRVHTRRDRDSGDRFLCRLEVLKDKRHGPTWTQAEVCRGPAGLR
jgi:recombination protein RecA